MKYFYSRIWSTVKKSRNLGDKQKFLVRIYSLKVLWHEIFLFQNMVPINVFISFLFFQVWSGNLAQIQNIGL